MDCIWLKQRPIDSTRETCAIQVEACVAEGDACVTQGEACI